MTLALSYLPELPPLYHVLDEAAEHRSTPIAGGAMSWRIWGDGPPLLMVHGMHGSWSHWIRNIETVSRRHRIYVPDLPAQGDSDGVTLASLDDCGGAIAEGLSHLGVTGGFDIVAFSFGTTVALHLPPAMRCRVRRMVLLGSAGLGPFARVSANLTPWRGVKDPVERARIHAANLAIMMFADPATVEPGVIAIQMRNAERTRVRRKEFIPTAKTLDRFSSWRPSELDFVWGSEDPIIKASLDQTRATIRSLTPAARMRVVAGAGHWVQYEAAAKVNALLGDL